MISVNTRTALKKMAQVLRPLRLAVGHTRVLRSLARLKTMHKASKSVTVKTGSDCLHLYLRVLPQLRKRILVHVHDVFLPFGLPKQWLAEWQLYWTEQYLVLALLIGNPKAKMMYVVRAIISGIVRCLMSS